MRIHRRFVLLLCLLLSLAAPGRADAWILRWIDELSGPGPFLGVEGDLRLVCFPIDSDEDPPRDDRASRKDKRGLIARGPCFYPKEANDRGYLWSVNLALGASWAIDNRLQYADPTASRRVFVFSVGPAVWIRPKPWVEVGTGFSIDVYEGGSFDVFRTFTARPLQIIAKPGFLSGPPPTGEVDWRDVFAVKFELIRTSRGFTAEDFGAKPGTFAADAEWRRAYAVVLDMAPFFKKSK